jgi:ABC-type nitrate/sulfonate/bicarbonate transport system ATPase subunit
MSDEVLVFSSRPATLTGRFVVPFPRPRSIEDMRGDVEFSKLYDDIWGLLKRDVGY